MTNIRDLKKYICSEDDDANGQARDEARGILGDLVKESFDPGEVVKWVSAAETRQDLFSNIVVGRILWPRVLGRPSSAALSDGFTISTKIWADVWHLGADGSQITDLEWGPGNAVVLRDGPFHPEHYSVSYLFHSPNDRPGLIEIQLADISWAGVRSVHGRDRYLSSHGFGFQAAGAFIALPDVTVDSLPFFHP